MSPTQHLTTTKLLPVYEFAYSDFFFFFGHTQCGMQDLIFLTRDRTRTPCSGSTEFSPLDRQGSPWAFHTNGIIQYVAFCVWLLSLSRMFLRFIHIAAYISSSFFFVAEYYFIYGCTIFCSFIHQLMDICFFPTFWLLWIMLLYLFLKIFKLLLLLLTFGYVGSSLLRTGFL